MLESTPLLHPNGRQEADSCYTKSQSVIFWEEMQAILLYALPILASQLLEHSLFVVEVISVGHLSTAALAAASLGSMTASVTGYCMIQGLTSALDTLLPSAFTSSKPQLMGLWAQRMCVVVFFALIPILAVWLRAETILVWIKQDPEIAKLSALYLRWLSFSLPAWSFNCISRRYFQSQGLFSIQAQINLFVAPINILLNYLLVWGPSFIRLGFIGAPIATTISTWLVSSMSIVYGIYFSPKTTWHPISFKMFTKLSPLLSLGISGIGQMASEWWAWEMLALAASFLSPLSLASQSVLLTSSSTTYQVMYALANATTIRVGNFLGEKKAKRASIAANASIVVALIVSLLISAMYLTFRKVWAHIFSDDPDVINLVASVLPLIALYQILDGTSSVSAGILRAKGQQSIGALLNISAYYLIGLPLGIWLAFKHDVGLIGLWVGMVVALTYCAVIGATLVYRTDWQHEVAKVEKRFTEDHRTRASNAQARLDGDDVC